MAANARETNRQRISCNRATVGTPLKLPTRRRRGRQMAWRWMQDPGSGCLIVQTDTPHASRAHTVAGLRPRAEQVSPRHPRSPHRRRPHTRCQEACQPPANRSTRHPSCVTLARDSPGASAHAAAQRPRRPRHRVRAFTPVLLPSCLPAALFRPPLHLASSSPGAREANPIPRYFVHKKEVLY